MPSELKPTTKSEREAMRRIRAELRKDGLDEAGDEGVLRLIADLDRRDALLLRLVRWDSSTSYIMLADIQAEAKEVMR